jgi:hypothetical protein
MEVAAVAGPIARLLPKLVSAIDKKRNQLDSLEVDAGFIQRDLQSIQDFICRSSGGSISDLWIRDLRRLADDMEDCIDSCQVGKTTRIRFISKIGKLKKRSKDTLEQLQNCISIFRAAAPPAAADPHAGSSEDSEEQLLALLGRRQSEDEKRKLKVISVAGFGGVGMTRLAHKVYSHNDVRSQFPLRAWIRAPPDMNVHKLLEEIHDQLRAKNAVSASSSKSIPQAKGDSEHGASASHHRYRLAGLLRTGR